MEDPIYEATHGVEPALRSVEPLIGPRGVGEDVSLSPMRLREHRHSLVGEVNDVTTPVLGSCCWQGPDPLIKIDLIPGDLVDLLAPLARQGKKLDDTTEWTADLTRGLDDPREFLVTKHSI